MTRIAVGQFMQESHSFTPIPCTWEQFHAGHIYRGSQIIDKMRDNRVEVAGAISIAEANGVEIMPTLACNAVSSGHIRAEIFESLLSELLARIGAVVALDGVFLALHGAMAADGVEDASGAVLAAVRGLVGADVPIVASLDMHANVTSKMMKASDGLIGYHTNPHVDLFETGAKGMQLLIDIIRGAVKPTMALRQLPLMAPPDKSVTMDGPFREVMEFAKGLEDQADVLSVCPYWVQPWLDLSDVGCSVVAITDDNPRLANEIAEKVADEFWSRRSQYYVELTPVDEAVRRAINAPRGPVILSDGSDAPSGGASGDSTAILRALLEAGVDRTTLLNIVDPRAAAAAISAGVNNDVTLSVGAWSCDLWQPVEISGLVRQISDGTFRFSGAGYRGREFHRGRTVVLQSGAIYLQIMERPVFQGDTALYESMGFDPREAHIVMVKTPSAFRANYESFAADVIWVDAPGLTSSNLHSFNWRNLPRPCYPFDDIDEWRDKC